MDPVHCRELRCDREDDDGDDDSLLLANVPREFLPASREERHPTAHGLDTLSNGSATCGPLTDQVRLISIREEYLQLLFDVRERVKEYLLVVDPSRLADTDRIIAAYGICPPALPHDSLQRPAAVLSQRVDRQSFAAVGEEIEGVSTGMQQHLRSVANFADAINEVRCREESMFLDLVRFFRVPMPVVRDAVQTRKSLEAASRDFFSPSPAAAAVVRPQAVLGRHHDNVSRKSAGGNVPFATPARRWRQRRSPPDGFDAVDRTTSRRDVRTHETNSEHVPALYLPFGVRPTGFDRRDATCSTCGFEAINPVELKHHRRAAHQPSFLEPRNSGQTPPSVAKLGRLICWD